MDRLNYERGGLDLNVRTNLDSACGAVYRKSTPKPFKFSEIQPGPDYYHPQDDLIKPKPIAVIFNKKSKKEKVEVDNRDYEINEDLMKKGGNIIINPEHAIHRLTEEEIRSLNRGPGFYDCLFSQVEKRNDIGIIAYQPIT